MPKKQQVEKVRPPPAKVRAAMKEQEMKERERKMMEDAYWEDNTQPKKHQVKHAMKAIKKDQTLQKKQELRRLQQEEDAELMMKNAAKQKAKKVTQYQIYQQKEKERASRKQADGRKTLEKLNITCQSDYMAQVDRGNVNHNSEENGGDSGIDGALLSLLSGKDKATVSMLSRSGVSASALQPMLGKVSGPMTYKMFEQQRMPDIKLSKPGLKASQYRELVRKEWTRSSMNPANNV